MLSIVPCGLSRPHKWEFLVPTAQIQPATHVCRFKMLNALDVVRIHSFCEQRSPDSHARNTEAGRNSSCTSAWTSLYHVNNVFIMLHISLYLNFSMAIYTLKGTFFSQMLMYMSEHVCQGFVVEDIVADILRQHQWCSRCKTRIRNEYRHILRRKMTCSLLLLTSQNDCSVCYLKQDSICVCYTPAPDSWLP